MAERRPIALVVGGGVAGLTCALALSRRWAVTVIDGGGGRNASRVAAGMLAPEAEAATDVLAPPLTLMREALALWPGFAAGIGAAEALHACGALALGDHARSRGEGWRVVSAEEARRLQPALGATCGGGAFAAGDLRVETAALMDRLDAALADAGVQRVKASATGFGREGVRLDDGRWAVAELVVAAAGAGLRGLADGVPEAAALSPIKGQLLRFPAGSPPAGGAMVRAAGGYLCPSGAGPIFGATMEAGRDDDTVDEAAVTRLAGAAATLVPGLSGGIGAAGVRAATPDGLPLVGWSAGGVLLAGGFRRNGWLLAPMAAEMIAAYADEADPGAWAGALAPGRSFSSDRR